MDYFTSLLLTFSRILGMESLLCVWRFIYFSREVAYILTNIFSNACALFVMYYYFYYYYLLQLGFHPVAVVLTLVHTIQMFSPGGSSPYTNTHNTNVFTRWQ
jgi:hypothetical protein